MSLPPLPPRLALAQLPTPLQPLNRLSEWLGGGTRIWVKRDDLTGSVLSGNKVRKLEFTLAQAMEEGCDTIITCGGVQSNHCRATALLCAQLGLRCHLVLRGTEPEVADGNLLLDQLAGASIEFHPARHYQQNLDSLLESARQRSSDSGHPAFIIPTGASDGIGVWGYLLAARELQNDFERLGIAPEHIVCATGSGGTQAGLTLGAHLLGLKSQVWGVNVCDDEAWFLNKVNQDVSDWSQRYQPDFDPARLNTRVIDGYVGAGYAIADAAIFETISLLARMEGLVLDPVYTGKAFHGMIAEHRAGRLQGKHIVFVHTGGTFGLFPQRDQLAPALKINNP
ncbi:D-cysteine desulfhydrase [Litorivivens lipolytica]|uniref:D-cysteine desulfhydrase n=1 Tax=Litorivivens lipolytica TaxID=1524264 RepID=A0A7W4Z484_9GAMM|nr:D-cysteine desulfhydrase [Litorivivens lipolytica]